MNSETTAKGIVASIIIVFSFLYNSFGILFVILITLMAIDYITGLVSAWILGKASSRVGIIGILKKIGYIALVVTALLFDLAIIHGAEQLGTTMPFKSFFGTIVICWLISNEAISVIENLGKMGVPTPKFLNVALEKFKAFFENMSQTNDKDGK